MKPYLFFLLAMTMFGGVGAQEAPSYQKMILKDDLGTMPYRLLLPKDYDTANEYPLVLVLHGSGERGNDNESQLVHGSDLFLQETVRDTYGAIVVFPQCAAGSSWAQTTVRGLWGDRTFTFYEDAKPTKDMQLLEKLVAHLKGSYPIDTNKMYVGGLSMGGMGTFELVRRNPEVFAAAFPICGGAHPNIAKGLKQPSWWVFHGDKDSVVPSKYSTEMVKALQKEGAAVQYTLYKGVGHNSWNNAFAEPELLPWLFSKTK